MLVADEKRPGWHNYNELIASQSKPVDRIETRADEPALIYFTSGTTGMPKMVLHTHASYGLGHRVTGRFWLDLRPDDLHWNVSDTGWAKAAWSSLFGPWNCGASLFVQHSAGQVPTGRRARRAWLNTPSPRCVPPRRFTAGWCSSIWQSFRPLALRHCVAAGEPLNPEVIAIWKRATGLTIRDGYGQTETVLLCGNFPGIDVKPGSMGLPTPGFELAVVDDAGSRAPVDQEGDLAVRIEPDRPLGLFREYWQDPEATSHAFRQGWYRTGDCGRVDADGYFWFIGRADDVINSSAYRIGPFEVESALVEHPAVVEAAVVGKPDPIRGEIVLAFVVLAKGYAACEALKTELQEHVKRTTAPYKYPREIEFVDDLPKTVSGKIRRVELRRRASLEVRKTVPCKFRCRRLAANRIRCERSSRTICPPIPTAFCSSRSSKVRSAPPAGRKSWASTSPGRSTSSGTPASRMLTARAIAKRGNTPHKLLGEFIAYLIERHGRKVASVNIQLR